MLLNLFFNTSTTKLLYSPQTLTLINTNLTKYTIKSQFPFLNFNNNPKTQVKSSLLTQLFSKKQHEPIFKLFLQYISNPTNTQLPFYYLQQNLRTSIYHYLNNNPKTIKINTFKIISSEMVEKMNIKGAFIHRKYNLNHNSYNATSNQTTITYTMKKSLNSQAIKMYQKVIRAYLNDEMEKDFLKDGIIVRYIYKIMAILKLQIYDKEGKLQIVGGQQPCQHLLQIQSIVNRYSNLEEYYLTDIDFVIKGNHHLKQKLY